MTFSYSLTNTTYDVVTKVATNTYSYLDATGHFVEFTGTELELQVHLGTL